MKKKLIRIYWIFVTQLGINPIRLVTFFSQIPYFISSWNRFRKNFSGKMLLMPCLHDRRAESGDTSSEYFWQDLYVAQTVYKLNPQRVIDIGSRVDGYVSHVASFRKIEVFDVRPILVDIPNVIFRQANLMDSSSVDNIVLTSGQCDFLSCLHAIEHFGLGRYGDPIDTQGFYKGIANLSRILLPDGYFILSTPVGIERVEFNANWVFNPETIIKCANNFHLQLISLHIIRKNPPRGIEAVPLEAINRLASDDYNLAIFLFQKD